MNKELEKEYKEPTPLYVDLAVTEEEVKEFTESRMWRVIVDQIKERGKDITNDLVKGDNTLGNDDLKRGRIQELELVLTIPQILIDDIRISQKAIIDEKEKEENGRPN